MTYYRTSGKSYAKYFAKSDGICYCKDVRGLFKELAQKYDPTEWRLFIDGSKYSLKAVLLHNGGKKPSVPVGHGIEMKESYETMAKMLKKINYDDHKWKLCGYLKVIALLTGLQGCYTKYCCFLCKWDSRARAHHYIRQHWPERDELFFHHSTSNLV